MTVDADARGTVLVADDEEILLRLVGRVLERAGYRVVPAGDGVEARRVLEGKTPLAVAILDASLEPAGAAALFDILDHAPGRPGLIVTGGEAPPDAMRQALEARGGRFLPKPFAPAQLLEAVEAACDGRAG
ncbi:MAG: response regulator [Myxococcota bacterium]|nr:response regulator [Myxococcota bacterium]